MQEPELNLATICKGGIPEVFKRKLAEVIHNIRDVNTSAEQKRTVTIEITFEPFKDRSGWLDSFTLKSKLAELDCTAAQGSAFIAAQDGELKAFAHDPRQTKLFAEEPTSTPKQ